MALPNMEKPEVMAAKKPLFSFFFGLPIFGENRSQCDLHLSAKPLLRNLQNSREFDQTSSIVETREALESWELYREGD